MINGCDMWHEAQIGFVESCHGIIFHMMLPLVPNSIKCNKSIYTFSFHFGEMPFMCDQTCVFQSSIKCLNICFLQC